MEATWNEQALNVNSCPAPKLNSIFGGKFWIGLKIFLIDDIIKFLKT